MSSPDRAASSELFPQPTFPTTTTREPCRADENDDEMIKMMADFFFFFIKAAHFTVRGGVHSL